MNIGTIIFTILDGDATLATLLGTSASTSGMKKIYPLAAPQKETAPFIVYNRIPSSPDHCAQGLAVRNNNMQIDAWANTPLQATNIAERVITLLDNYDGTVDGHRVEILLESESDAFEPDLDSPLYGGRVEVSIRIPL